MNLTPATLEAKRTELTAQREQLIANLHAVNGARESAISNPTFDLGSVQSAVIDILGRMRNHGFIAT